MKTIHKLVLKAYLGPMVLTFFIVMFVLMMNIVWRYIDELVGKGLSAGIIIELMTYFMANMIPLGLPLAMLLAAIMTMGNLGENYELLAMKSAGMSLVRITKPLIILVSVIAVGSFFIGNNLVPYANKKVYSIIYDIRQQKQSLEFQDGLFFNGIDNMSIRVSRQEPKTHLLRDVLIYDNRIADGNMNTIVADSGYIRLSDDKRFLLVTLFNGEMYEQTRNSQWFTQSRLRHHIFDKQDQTIPMEGFAMQRSDANQFSNSQTKNINELQQDIDSLEILVNNATTRSYEPLLKEQIFSRDNSVLPQPDSLRKDKSGFGSLEAMDSLSALKLRDKARIWNQARTLAKSSRNMFSFDESAAKDLGSIHSMKRRARPEDVMAAERPMAPMRNSSTLLPKPNVTSLSKLATPKICRNTIRPRDVAGKGMASVIHWMTAKQRTAITILAFAVSGMASSPL